LHEGDDNAGVELKRNKNSTTAEGSNTDKNPGEKDAEKISSNEEDEDKVKPLANLPTRINRNKE
jgi:hypothetical protein